MANERNPLLPTLQLEDPSIDKRLRFSRRNRAILVVACLCVGLFGIWKFSIDGNFGKNGRADQDTFPPATHQERLNDGINFLVVGDWGRKGLYNQSLVATQMGIIGQQLGIEFVISVGDNFYDTGLAGIDDPAFALSFMDVYTATSLQTTWYTVLGNHDYMGDVLSQLSDGLASRDPRWYCRRAFQLNYTSCRNGSDTETCRDVDMFFFDTTPFIYEYWSPNATHVFDWRGLAPREEQLQSQIDDLASALNLSTATWKIVVGHHTIRSIGHHGEYSELVEKLLPILEKYEVDVYINGHDHNLQHIKRVDSSIHLFTSGGGSKAYSGLRSYTDEEGVQFAYDGQGFLAVAMRGRSITFSFYDTAGDAIYSTLISK